MADITLMHVYARLGEIKNRMLQNEKVFANLRNDFLQPEISNSWLLTEHEIEVLKHTIEHIKAIQNYQVTILDKTQNELYNLIK